MGRKWSGSDDNPDDDGLTDDERWLKGLFEKAEEYGDTIDRQQHGTRSGPGCGTTSLMTLGALLGAGWLLGRRRR